MTAPAPPAAIAEGVREVRERIAAACARAGRHPDAVTLVAVTKTRTAAEVAAAVQAGVTDIGENYVQEGAAKLADVAALAGGRAFRRHFIGRLQRNKVRAALEAFDVFHGVDSAALLEAMARHAGERRVPVFLQVNLSNEPTKGGVAVQEVRALVERARTLHGIELLGVMTVPPPAATSGEARPWFRQLRELAQEHGLGHLSMGMTDDFEVAIEEGATHVRVGRAIFGERTP
jgi:PLP dependent protein